MRHDTKFHKGFMTARPTSSQYSQMIWKDRFIERKLSNRSGSKFEKTGQELAGNGEFVFEGEVLRGPRWR